MAKKRNTNFRLGLDRQELIEASIQFGKKPTTAKRENTKRLEQYIINKIAGRGTKIPDFTEREKRDIADSTKSFGIQDGLHLLAYRTRKVTGNQDESNFLRLTVARGFSAFYEGAITKQHIDELVSRLPQLARNEIISGLSKFDSYYTEMFLEYSSELVNE